MSQHTPGPWRVSAYASVVYGGTVDAAGGFPHGRCVAQCPSSSVPPDERLANARLIAAAPEMLEACRVALCACVIAQCDASDMGGADCEESKFFDDTIKKLRAAIALAAGERS